MVKMVKICQFEIFYLKNESTREVYFLHLADLDQQ